MRYVPGLCLGLAFSWAIQSLPAANACPICFPIPVRSAADYLIENETVAFAREDPDRPFSYRVVRFLKGKSQSASIDHFVDSATRRRLDAYPTDVVLFVRASEDDPWLRVAIADVEYQQVLERIVAFASEWTGKDGAERRLQYFVTLFGHEDPSIFELAYIELGRAPYGMIRKIASSVPRDRLRPILTRREYVEWRPLAILILAQDPSEEERHFIEDSFRNGSIGGVSSHVAAWATAYLELNGETALDEIETTWLKDSSRSLAEVREVIRALSVHGRTAHGPIRDRIVNTYIRTLQTHPELVGPVVTDLAEWRRWEFRKDVEAALVAQRSETLDKTTTRAVRNYMTRGDR